MGAYKYCKWCHGQGCMYCNMQREIDANKPIEPMFIMRDGYPEDLERMKMFAHREVIEKELSPGGGGIREINRLAALARILQTLDDPEVEQLYKDAAIDPKDLKEDGE